MTQTGSLLVQYTATYCMHIGLVHAHFYVSDTVKSIKPYAYLLCVLKTVSVKYRERNESRQTTHSGPPTPALVEKCLSENPIGGSITLYWDLEKTEKHGARLRSAATGDKKTFPR